MAIELTLTGAQVLRPDGWDDGPLALSDGVLSDLPVGRQVDLRGYQVLPGIVDAHGDGFERHMAPRRGALREASHGVAACAAELAANGITTAVLAQFFSWEGGMRGPDFAEHVFASVAKVAPGVPTDLRLQLRLETHLLDDYARAEAAVARFGIDYVVFNDHLPHARLAEGRHPPRLTGQALKSGRNPEAHFRMMLDLHARSGEVRGAVTALAARLRDRGVVLGSHDDHDSTAREVWRRRGVSVSEFPETASAAQSARDAGESVVLGSPNVVRGASHAGNASALDLVAAGWCDALASDYHYPSPLRAAWRLADLGVCDMVRAWGMVSQGPARLLGLDDRGRIEAGLRADLVVLDPKTHRVAACFAAGAVSFMTGAVAERFLR
ncbi:alpha-D-ribose 1-methylphosphonate 5-triphosphate diphosphatase [Puniceibacterium sp. IMCC21224]|uniref:alpha-D-ribose 1-methylphosphonate 5-triphosphate diphosphatase n=1 Tax=Puniceibacterium sp. IMCC21224 TaxID=1618204 RepID=UPI00064D98F7|nr:alpha-D-ribose 1-methylphosphonate 5-triphosphate diphosphatase [Puniceibacterium sp. IMCC21224]KMK68619.1 metal-dependent hydrolase involved in phosphonate metabolism [Puniceibacterium sp. IMCC21224]